MNDFRDKKKHSVLREGIQIDSENITIHDVYFLGSIRDSHDDNNDSIKSRFEDNDELRYDDAWEYEIFRTFPSLLSLCYWIKFKRYYPLPNTNRRWNTKYNLDYCCNVSVVENSVILLGVYIKRKVTQRFYGYFS